MESNQEQSTSLVVFEPIKVGVGKTYEMMYQNRIISITVQKIVHDNTGGLVGFICTKHVDKGLLRMFSDEAITISATDMRQRVLVGGAKEVVL